MQKFARNQGRSRWRMFGTGAFAFPGGQGGEHRVAESQPFMPLA